MTEKKISLDPDEWKIVVTNIRRQLYYTLHSIEAGRYDIDCTARSIRKCMDYIDTFWEPSNFC